jgi:hypothetical protein
MTNSYLTARTLSKFGGDKLDNKIYLRRQLLDRVEDIYIDQKVLMLTGENYTRCMKELKDRNLISKHRCKIAIVERDNKVFRKIFTQAEECPFYKKGIVDLHKCDIKNVACYDYHFQDIDLMCTWKNGFDILKKRLALQSESISKEKSARGSKFFMFSLSEWGIKLEESYSYLKDLLETLNCKIWGLDKCEGRYGDGVAINSIGHRSFIRQHKIYCNEDDYGSVKKFLLFRYRDTTNMMTCLIEHGVN